MSHKIPPGSSQKGFAVGQGLLAAAETLNFSMNEQRSAGHLGPASRQLSGLSSTMSGAEGQGRDSQLPLRGGSSHLSNTVKLFASLGLSPADLDVLAQIPEDNISVETLPQLIMQLKSRKVEADRMVGSSRDLSSRSPDTPYRAPREDWQDLRAGRLGGGGGSGQTSACGQQMDFGYSSMPDVPARGFDLDYSNSSGGGNRGRHYSELSHDRYGGFSTAGSSASDGVFMQRKMGSPSQGKVQDFLGAMPHLYPHVCSLCDFDVHSTMEWTQHINGLCHAENRKLLLQMYPDWDPPRTQNRGSGSFLHETTNRAAGLLGAFPMSRGMQSGGMTSGWGGDADSGISGKSQQRSIRPKIRSRVVVAKYDRKPLSNKSLFDLAQPFGSVVENLVLKNKAFLEMRTHKEALDMVNFYQRKPARLYGKEIHFYLSKELLVIEKGNQADNRAVKGRASQVVFFSNLPREKMELLTIAGRFGTVEKHLFLNQEAFVQMGTPEDAEMLVKYYTLNPLTIKGKAVSLNICTKYKTLTVNPSRNNDGRQEDRGQKCSTSGGKSSSKSPKSASASAREASNQSQEPQMSNEDAIPTEGSGDEITGVMEADERQAADHDLDEDFQEIDATTAEIINGDPASDNLCPESQDVESAKEVPEEKAFAGEVSSREEPDMDEQVPLAEEQGEDSGESEQEESRSHPDELELQSNTAAPETTGSLEVTNEGQMEDEEKLMEQDFPENLDDFVTLDELAEEEDLERRDFQSTSNIFSSGQSKKSGGLRVVNVVGFKRGYGFLDEILSLAIPFGKVVRHLVLDIRAEAFLQLSTEEEARAMVNFYSGNVTPTVCGKAVKIYHSQTYATIQSGRVVYVGQIPQFKTSDASLLKIAEPFGKVRRYFLNRSRNECFIEMERGEDAEAMANSCKDNPPKFQGKRLTVYVSRKYKQLKHGHRPPPPDPEDKRPPKRERPEEEGDDAHSSPAARAKAEADEAPPVKKVCVKEEKELQASAEEPDNSKAHGDQAEEMPREQSEVVVKKEEAQEKTHPSLDCAALIRMDAGGECKREEQGPTLSTDVTEKSAENDTSPAQLQTEKKPANALLSLGPYEPSNPVGVEFVKMGYYCRVCFLFYSNEDTAKKVHCSSQAHYEKLKKHLEKEKAKSQSITKKMTS